MCVSPPVSRDTIPLSYYQVCTVEHSRGAVDHYHSLPNEDSDSLVVISRIQKGRFLDVPALSLICIISCFTYVKQYTSLDYSPFCSPSQGLTCSRGKALMSTEIQPEFSLHGALFSSVCSVEQLIISFNQRSKETPGDFCLQPVKQRQRSRLPKEQPGHHGSHYLARLQTNSATQFKRLPLTSWEISESVIHNICYVSLSTVSTYSGAWC